MHFMSPLYFYHLMVLSTTNMLLRTPRRHRRWLSVRRSRNMIRAAGLEGSRGARFREVAYTAQQVFNKNLIIE